MKKILFHIASFPACNEMFAIIDVLLESKDFTIHVLVENAKLSEYIRKNYNYNDIDLIDRYFTNDAESTLDKNKSSKTEQIDEQKDLLKQVFTVFKSKIYQTFLFKYHKKNKLVKELKKREQECGQILDFIKPQSIVVRGDRHIGNLWEPALLKACGKRKIKRVIIPIAQSSPESLIKMRITKKELDAVPSTKDFRHFKQQIIQDPQTGKHVFYKPVSVMSCLEKVGMLPENPWVMGGGNSDILLAESWLARDRFIADGCDKKKIIVTGHGAHDRLYLKHRKKEEVSTNIRNKYHLSQEKPLAILSLPQLGEHKIMKWEGHWDEIRFLCETAKKFNKNVLISLHPRMNPEQYSFINDEYGLAVAEERLVEILPCADAFWCTFSSTVDWSVLCGIPTIIFDFYNFNYSIYNDFPSLKIIKEKSKLLLEFDRILSDINYLESCKQMTREDSKKVGIFDGKCIARIINGLEG